MTRIVFVPAGYSEAADRIAASVDRGLIKVMPHWLTKAACQTFIDSLPAYQRCEYAPTAAVIRVAGDAAPAVPLPPTQARLARVSGKPRGESHAA